MNKTSFAMPVALAIATLVSACATPKPQPEAPPPPPPVAQNQKLSSDNLFAFGKSSLDDISDEGRAQLDAFATTLLGGHYEMIHVIGHSDRIGNAKANVDLSTKRAASVRDYLVQKGVPANRITAVGRGSVEPVVECGDTERKALIACLAPNRRVEIRIVAAQ